MVVDRKGKRGRESVKDEPQFPGLHTQVDVDAACRSQRLVKLVGTRPGVTSVLEWIQRQMAAGQSTLTNI